MADAERRQSPLVLLFIAGEVLSAANAARPASVTQRAYDEARVTLGYERSPRASQLARRFAVPWSRFTQILATEEYPVRALAAADYQRTRQRRTRAECVSAIVTAAASLNQGHISPQSYDQARKAVNAHAQRRHLHGRLIEPLPSRASVSYQYDFGELVREAGLRPSPRQGVKPMPRADAVSLFVEHCGFSPTNVHLIRLCAMHGVRLADQRADPHVPAVALAAERFRADGRWYPPPRRFASPPDADTRITTCSEAIDDARRRHPAKRRAPYSRAELVAMLDWALDLIPDGEVMTAWEYDVVAGELPAFILSAQLRRRAHALGASWPELVGEVLTARAQAMRTP